MSFSYSRMEGEGNQIIKSYPFKIRFAGFTGDTLSLAAQGWSFSMYQNMDHRYGSLILQLALKHDGMQLHAMTNGIQIDRHFYSPGSFMETLVHYAEIGFNIAHIAPSIRVCAVPAMMYGNPVSLFEPIDVHPTVQDFDLKDLRFFKPANPQLKDVLVTPEQVPELMEMILKEQKKVLAEVKRREQSRMNFDKYHGIPVKPSHEVQLQLVTLTG